MVAINCQLFIKVSIFSWFHDVLFCLSKLSLFFSDLKLSYNWSNVKINSKYLKIEVLFFFLYEGEANKKEPHSKVQSSNLREWVWIVLLPMGNMDLGDGFYFSSCWCEGWLMGLVVSAPIQPFVLPKPITWVVCLRTITGMGCVSPKQPFDPKPHDGPKHSAWPN